MKVKDEVAWSQAAEWFDSTPERQAFRDYLVFWTEAAEKLMEEGEPVYAALQGALPHAEEHIGELDDPNAFGQMLVFVIGLWAHGEEIVDELTQFETKVLATAVRLHITELQQLAEDVGGSG